MSKSTIALQSVERETFKFEFESGSELESLMFELMIEDNCRYTSIVTGFNSKALAKVSEYRKRHVEDPNSSDEDLMFFDIDFVREDLRTLEDVNSVARYLGIKSLEDLTSAFTTMAETPEQRWAERVARLLELQHIMYEAMEANGALMVAELNRS